MKKIRLHMHEKITSFRMIILGFLLVILAGAVILSLPVSSQDGIGVPFADALFTAASAACVTGLVVYDTAVQWTLIGRTVILILIQIGGLGVVTVLITLMMASGRKIGLMERISLQDSVSAPELSGVVRFTRFFLKGTVIAELIGTACLMPVFCPEYGLIKGAGYALFHSVSAFCNAGFDLMGKSAPFASMSAYASNPVVNTVICLLIFTGGIGFLTWSDLIAKRFRWRNLRLQTKLVLCTAGVLIAVPFLYFYFVEFRAVSGSTRFWTSLFQTVTPRTAGFATTDYGKMSEGGLMLTVFLMIVGGAPGSTAGGIKVTTAAIIFLSTVGRMQGKEDVNCFKRRIDRDTVSTAYTIFVMYTALLFAGTVAVSVTEGLPAMPALFECASALGTVGLTTGITPQLSVMSKLILIFFMYFGRVGALTLAYAMVPSRTVQPGRFPAEKLSVG